MNERKQLLSLVLTDIEKILDKGVVTPDEVFQVVSTLIELIAGIKRDLETRIITESETADGVTNAIKDDLRATERRLTALMSKLDTASMDNVETKLNLIRTDIEALWSSLPKEFDPADLLAQIAEVEAKIPTIPEIPKPLTASEVKDMVLSEGLEITDVNGLDEALKNAQNVEIVSSPSRGFFLYVDGVKKGLLSTINFKSGSNMSISHAKVNGMDTITFTSSGGSGPGGLTIETPPESVNASRVAFTVSAQPSYMVADGTTYFAGAGYSYAALTVTFDVPPSQYVRAII